MIYRMFALVIPALALLISAPVWAADDADKSTHDGKVVSITSEKLVMTSKDGKEHTHTLATDAKVTCDGKVCKLEDLKAGMKIRVTTKKDDKKVATRIEALDKSENFEKRNQKDKP
jgi:hypothetical protein